MVVNSKKFKYQKVAITGASGFIGKYLFNSLLRNNFEISVLDSSGFSYPDKVNVVKGNLFSTEGIDKFLEGSEVLIHLAGQVLPGSTTMDEGNFVTTKNLISKVNNCEIQKIIFTSTVAVYGSSHRKVFRESDICNPVTEYGLSKLKAERLIEDWGNTTGNQYVILRPFSVYGPGNNKGLIYNLCNDFINKGVVTVYGNGQQKRDLVYVEDAVKALIFALEPNLSEIYNIGTGKNYSVLDIISILEKVAGRKCKVVFRKQDLNKTTNTFYSVEKIKKETGWIPEVLVEEGLRKVYQSLLNSF